MAETNGSLQQNNPTFHNLFHALDPISLLLSQNSDPQKPPVSLKLITESYFMERGPRYDDYAQLRESKLRRKNSRHQEENEVYEPKQSPLKKQVKFQSNQEENGVYEPKQSPLKKQVKFQHQEENEVYEPKQSPLKKQVKFQSNLTGSRKGSSVSSVLAQSVPDFSATLRKENRKPMTSTLELTPPSKNWSRMNGNLSNSRGSKSANAGEKKGAMARKSYASIEELKGLSMGVSKDICGENRGRNGRAKTVLGTSRQFSMFG